MRLSFLFLTLIFTLTVSVSFGQATAEDYLVRGDRERSTKRFDLAIADYTRAIEIEPTFDEAYAMRALALAGKGDTVGAIADSTRAIGFNPKCIHAYFIRGGVRRKLGDFDGAFADFTKLINLLPNSNTYCIRAGLLVQMKDYDGAIADYTDAIKLEPQSPDDPYSGRGKARYGKDDIDGAIVDFTKSIEIKPTKASYYRDRAAAYRKVYNIGLAEADERRAAELEKKE